MHLVARYRVPSSAAVACYTVTYYTVARAAVAATIVRYRRSLSAPSYSTLHDTRLQCAAYTCSHTPAARRCLMLLNDDHHLNVFEARLRAEGAIREEHRTS